MSSNYELSIQKVASVISGLSLSISGNVIVQDIGDEDLGFTSLPGVTVFPFGAETLNPSDGATTVDEIGYPVVVGILDTKGAGASSRDQRLTWRRTMQQALQHKKWTDAGFTGQFDTRIEPGPVIDGGLWFRGQKFVSMFTVRVFWRENRL
ncbi:MAG: hypothetical protein U0872_14180 [Planctomycetaceae bacterium]